MKTKNELLVSGLIGATLTMTALLLYNTQIQAQAQIEPTDRYFQNDLCATEKTLFDDISYSSPQDPLSYDISDCPTINVTVHRWNELTTGEKTLITVRLNAQGYSDVTNQVLSQ